MSNATGQLVTLGLVLLACGWGSAAALGYVWGSKKEHPEWMGWIVGGVSFALVIGGGVAWTCI